MLKEPWPSDCLGWIEPALPLNAEVPALQEQGGHFYTGWPRWGRLRGGGYRTPPMSFLIEGAQRARMMPSTTAVIPRKEK